MTDECAQKMLADLKEHFGQPVLPLHDFCAAISTWMRCIEQGNADNPGGRQQGSEYWKELGRIEMDISKSGLVSCGAFSIAANQCERLSALNTTVTWTRICGRWVEPHPW